MPEKIVLEGSNITLNSFPVEQVDWSAVKHAEFHCVPTSGQHELVRSILAGSKHLLTCIFYGYFPLDMTLQMLSALPMSLLPLESLALKIQGFQLTFSQLLSELSSYAKVLEIETNAKNDLTFEFSFEDSGK